MIIVLRSIDLTADVCKIIMTITSQTLKCSSTDTITTTPSYTAILTKLTPTIPTSRITIVGSISYITWSAILSRPSEL